MQNRASKIKFADFMINHIEKKNWLFGKAIDVAWFLLWEKINIEGFEDTGLVWNQFLQRREKDFGQILLIKEKEHWIIVYRKGDSEINICDSLRNSENKIILKTQRLLPHRLLYVFSTKSELYSNKAIALIGL